MTQTKRIIFHHQNMVQLQHSSNWDKKNLWNVFFFKAEHCGKMARNLLLYFSFLTLQGPPPHIDAFQTNIFSWFNGILTKSQWLLGSWDREIWYKKIIFYFINLRCRLLRWPPRPQKEKVSIILREVGVAPSMTVPCPIGWSNCDWKNMKYILSLQLVISSLSKWSSLFICSLFPSSIVQEFSDDSSIVSFQSSI